MTRAATIKLPVRMEDDDGLMWLGHSQVESWRDEHYRYDCSKREGAGHVVLQMTLLGAAFHQGDQGRQLVRPGQAFLDYIPGPFHYGYATEVGGTYKLVYLALVGTQARRWSQRITGQFGHVLQIGLEGPIHTMMLAMIHQNRRHAPRGDRYSVSGQIYQLFMAILSQLTQSRLDQTPRISDAVSLVHQQAAEASFNVQTLAAQMGCSREYLSRQFHHAAGISPSEAIMQRRLEIACGLLRQNVDKLDSIARASGFASANYFCRMFRQRFGVTPGQYRSEPGMILRQRR